eukprot:COSAG01_NODE_66750_length_269_cov_0.605882_1_plen_26_part_10
MRRAFHPLWIQKLRQRPVHLPLAMVQ